MQYALVGPDLAKLDEYTGKAVEALEQGPGPRRRRPHATCRAAPSCGSTSIGERAADLGVRVQDVSQTVNALLAGQEVTTFNAASDQYDVVLKAQDSFRRTPESIAAATVRTAQRRAGAAAQPRHLRRGRRARRRSTA